MCLSPAFLDLQIKKKKINSKFFCFGSHCSIVILAHEILTKSRFYTQVANRLRLQKSIVLCARDELLAQFHRLVWWCTVLYAMTRPATQNI